MIWQWSSYILQHLHALKHIQLRHLYILYIIYIWILFFDICTYLIDVFIETLYIYKYIFTKVYIGGYYDKRVTTSTNNKHGDRPCIYIYDSGNTDYQVIGYIIDMSHNIFLYLEHYPHITWETMLCSHIYTNPRHFSPWPKCICKIINNFLFKSSLSLRIF